MAAIYSGIHLKLKSPKTSWEDKLKLAQFAWISHQCFLPNKEQVLLDWVSHTLVSFYNKKLELPDEITEKLWVYLDSILHSRKLQGLFKDGKAITLRFSIAQVINERLSIFYTQKKLKNLSTLLSCCSGILSSSPLSIVYTTKFELLVDLLSKLSNIACQQFLSEDIVSSQLFEVLLLTFGQYLLAQKQQANANRVFGQVTKRLFQPCLLLRHLLTTGVQLRTNDDGHTQQHLGREIRNHVEALLRVAVFPPELLQSYTEELVPEKDSHNIKKGGLKHLLLPVNTIQSTLADPNICQPTIHGKVVANSVPLLFKLFLESYNKTENHLLCFHMLTKLFQCLKISHLQGDHWNNALSSAEWSSDLLAMEQLLHLVLSSNIYNVAADRIRHKEVQFHFYQQLAQLLVNHPHAAIPAWFRCLNALISLNHLIVEPDLDDLLASAWIDAEVSEPRTKKAQESLVGALFHSYTKLRQFQKLFEEVLDVVCRPAAEELRLPILPAGIKNKLCECLQDLPPSQILDVISLILEKCRTVIIPDLRGDSDMALKLHSMSTLLHSVLFHMTSLDDSTPLPIVRRTQSLLETVQTEVIQVLFNLLKNVHTEKAKLEVWAEKVGDSLLLLACTWVATDTLFELNCRHYISPLAKANFTLADSTVDILDFSTILPGLDVKSWKKITKLLSCVCSTSRYCTEWLMLQKMKNILMHTAYNAEPSHEILQHASAFILESGQPFFSGEEAEPWDGSAGSINCLSYPTAHWHLVVSNLPVLFPYLSLSNTQYVAGMLLKTLLVNKMQMSSDDESSFITIEKVSKDLLCSSLLPEMCVLHSSFFSHIIQHSAGVLLPVGQSIVNQPIQQLSAENIPWCDSPPSSQIVSTGPSYDPSVCWAAMEKVAQNILSLAKKRSFINLEEDHIERLLDLLEIISALHLDSLFPLDHTRCFLLLVSLAVNTRAACSETLSLKFLTTCFHLLAQLQTSRNANSSFKVFYASDVLEAILTSMFAACETFSSIFKTSEWDEFLHSIQTFLEYYLQLMFERRRSVKLNLEKFMSFLATCQPYATNIKHSKCWSPAADQLLLVALTAQCHTLTLHLQQQHGKPQVLETRLNLLEQAIQQTMATIVLCLQNNPRGQPLPVTFIPCITTLLKADSSYVHLVSLVPGESESESPVKPDKAQKLSHSELYKQFYVQILKELDLASGNVQFLYSSLQFLTVFCSMPEMYSAQVTPVAVFHSIRKLLLGPGIQFIQDLEVQLTELMTQLMEKCTTDNFCTILRLLLEDLDISNIWKQNSKAVLSAVTLIKVLLSCPVSGEKEKAFWFSSPQIITALVLQAKEASQDAALLPTLIVPVLETVAILLRRGEGMLSNPHHVTLVFSILLTAPLDQRDYGSIFLGIHEVLFSILQCHPKVMLKAAPSFLNSFHRLVVSVMHEGRQKGNRGIADESEVILKCAHLVERMYTYIAAKTEEFTVLSPFIVAQYVMELQKVTLHPAIKKHLTEGIYHILDLCLERDIKFLNATLPAGVREVLKELYRDYNHYHKSLKQGDEKYTA
nr:PREDICTED: unhealthy ribosome biogenesis protein 2 homolog [Anolis carolinensis]XP_008122602.1 PREDICTED: unhealthy ribosome biogenesis protein 2 homolog [Anolis carolinensis]XP_016854763.1 PREDICTED: unhealthy ribosome biogenesis protein 2 homolog [Anolis carolinensis]|eukprot:XP_008122597.1 PREDICTED: unhealthy ribosome biogenesis protein 2 homolog [Anolis carolinensis]